MMYSPINTVASPRVAVSSVYAWAPYTTTTLGGLPAMFIDGKGATFLWVHGGPYIGDPVGNHTGELLAFAQRVFDKGGHRHYTIDYRNDWNSAHTTVDWTESVADVVSAAQAAKALHPDEPLILVAHSWAGALCSIATLRDGVADAYAPINAICSLAGIGQITSSGMPDPFVLAANRPTMPVAVITGSTLPIPPADDKQGFVNALAKAGHPGIYTLDTGDHTGTLGTDETANTLVELVSITHPEVVTPMLDGIDVSAWQKTTPPLTGLSFLFARATYDISPDSMYATHIANARKAGLRVGAYHFGTGKSTPQAQAAAFLKAAGDVDFYVLDLESDPVPMTQAEATAFIGAVKATGRPCGLYHSASGFPTLGQSYNWVAKWGTVPPLGAWAFWQYQGSPLDKDHFAGTVADLTKLAYKPAPPTPPDPKPGTVLPLPAGTKFFAHSTDITPVGGITVRYGFTLGKATPNAMLGTVRCWVSNLPLGATGTAAIPAGTKLYAHRGDKTGVGAMTVRYGFTVESQVSGWTLGSIKVWVKK